MDKKCILPWIHLQVDSDGSVRPCCNVNKSIEPFGNVLKEDVVTIWNNDKFKELREQMISGVEPDMCKPCYDSERLGLYSKRLRENVDWSKYTSLMDTPYTDFKIKHLDVRFDNVCNFKCRYCSPWLSHSWYNDYKKLGIPVKTETAINVNGLRLLEIIKDNVLDDLESVFFCGGEPLIMDEHLELLKLLDAKKKYKTKLLYITNLSKLSYKGIDYIELWNKFEDVNIHFSLDTIGSKLEYIRCGAKWTVIEKNLKTLFAHKEKLKPKIGITVSMFNAPTVLETVEYLVGTGLVTYEDIGLHLVKQPAIYSCQVLPDSVKEQITNDVNVFLKKHNLPHFFKSRYEYFINYMNSDSKYQQHKTEFAIMTKKLDDIRQEDFATIFPELKNYYD